MRTNGNRERIISNENRVTTVVLLGILSIALILRMGWPTLAAFKRDEATVARRALAIAYEGELPAAGVGLVHRDGQPAAYALPME